MPNIFSLIGESWDFYRKQPVLNHIALWLFLLPNSAFNVLATLQEWNEEQWFSTPVMPVLLFLVMVLLSVVLVWGSACVLLMGKRMVVNRAGRTRTSFKAVRMDAAPLIFPIIATAILQICGTLLWALAFIVPGIIYNIRTTFYPVVIATEGMTYRSALRASKEVVKGQTWTALLHVIGLNLVLFVPLYLLDKVLLALAQEFDPRLLLAVDVISAAGNAFATIFFLLAVTLLYGELKKRKATLVIAE